MQEGFQDMEKTSIERLAEESEKVRISAQQTSAGQWTDLGAWETDSRMETHPSALTRSRPISPLTEKPVIIRRRRMSARKQGSPSCESGELERNRSQRELSALKYDTKTHREARYQLSLIPAALKPPLPRQIDPPKPLSEDYSDSSHLPKPSAPRFFKANLLTESSPAFLSKPSPLCDHSLLDLHKMREFLSVSTEGARSCGPSPQGVGKKLMARKRLYS